MQLCIILISDICKKERKMILTKKKFALALRSIRTSQGTKLSQWDIADMAGISLRYYSYLENGQKMPTLDTVNKIAEAYGMKLSDFCKIIEEL